jgi:YegS/Rv2252/BmrU family lipid kinase
MHQYSNQIQCVAILPNPNAGNGKALMIAKRLSQRLIALNIEYTLFNNDWPSEQTLTNFSDAWIIGGDGTINYFINKYPCCSLNLALFNAGTGNDFAWKLYGDANLKDRLNQVLNANPKPIDIGVVNEKLYINCMGIGFDGEIIQSMKSIRFLGGHLGYMVAVLIKILGFKSPTLTIQTAQEKYTGKFLLALFVNSSRAGGGFFIAPSAQVDDGQLDMVLCEALPIWKRLIYLPIIKKGKHLQLPFIKHQLGAKYSIAADKTLPIQVDGELIFGKIINVSLHHHQFKFRY